MSGRALPPLSGRTGFCYGFMKSDASGSDEDAGLNLKGKPDHHDA
jgi:hypothetical protein